MSIADVAAVLSDIPTLLTLKKGMKPRPIDEKDCYGQQVVGTANRFGDSVAVLFEGASLTWRELNEQSNRYAGALSSMGIGRGDVVSLMMENRTEFLSLCIAINKLGAVAALINTNLRERALAHCISTSKSKLCVFGSELNEAVEGVRTELSLDSKDGYAVVPDGASDDVPDWAANLTAMSSNLEPEEPQAQFEVTLRETAFYIFTSGTTGLPKAAVMSNRRFLQMARLSMIAGLRATSKDRIHLCLPLYHGTGLVIGVGAALLSGAGVVLQRRFSASGFMDVVRSNNVTHVIYVGEMLRYLYNSPEKPDDAQNPIHTIMGNGLRPDIWVDFKRRFGIKRVTEFYSASEGNTAFANVLNRNCTVGLTTQQVELVRYDPESGEIIRTEDGGCERVAEGEPGLCIGHINPNAVFEGYTDESATEGKILRDVFEKGDAWFNTGDLLKTVNVGFSLGFPHYQFVDRLGDTFRWRSENVSTNEVGEILNGYSEISMSNVFGVEVPGSEGRAGMAAVSLDEGVDQLNTADFSEYVQKNLAPFARPVFVRVQPTQEVTGTFKMVKKDLKEEGYDVNAVDDPIYVLKPRATEYELLDSDYLAEIQQGSARF